MHTALCGNINKCYLYSGKYKCFPVVKSKKQPQKANPIEPKSECQHVDFRQSH